MGFWYISTISFRRNIVNTSYVNNFILSNVPHQRWRSARRRWLWWFLVLIFRFYWCALPVGGGTEHFLITLDRNFVKFRFKISDALAPTSRRDIEVLNTIKSKLKIGRVSIEKSRNRCSFIVENFADIKNVICPLFRPFPLHTSKKLDFEDFCKAVLIKDHIKKKNYLVASFFCASLLPPSGEGARKYGAQLKGK